MLRKIRVVAISLAISGFSMAACATTAGIGFTNIGIHAGDGLNMSLPGGSLTATQSLGSGYQVNGHFLGAGGENQADFFLGNVGVGKVIHLGEGLGTVTPSLNMGFQSLNVQGSNLSAATAFARVKYDYAINHNVKLYAQGGFGRDFATSVTNLSTIGGLMYNAGVGANFLVGPGTFNVGYEYSHLPLSGASGLHLSTDQYQIGYSIMF
jgi:hypothetical protein